MNIVTSWTATFSLFFWRWKKINFVCAWKSLKPIKTFISGLSSARELCPCMYVCPGSNSFRNWTYLNVTVQRVWMSQWYPSRATVNSAEFSQFPVFVLWLWCSEPYDCSCNCHRMKTDNTVSSDCWISVLHYVMDIVAFYVTDIVYNWLKVKNMEMSWASKVCCYKHSFCSKYSPMRKRSYVSLIFK